MATDKDGYFVNDTGKTMQELLQDAKSKREVPLCIWDVKNHPELPNDKDEHIVLVNFPHLYLTNSQILELDANEPVSRDRGRGVRLMPLKETKPYKRAMKYEKEKRKQNESAIKLQEEFDRWKVEPSAPVSDITDIFEDYQE